MNTLHKILDLMWEKGISEAHLCKAAGINKSAVTDWKKGKTKSYLKHISKIAEVLNVSEDYLLGCTDSPKTTDDDLIKLLEENKGKATIIGFGDGRHITTDMTYEDFEEIEAMWKALKEKRNKK